MPAITAEFAWSSTMHDRPTSFSVPGPTSERVSWVEYPRRITVPQTSLVGESSRAWIARFVSVRNRVACVVSIPSPRMARAPPGAVVIVTRLPGLPTAVITSRVANDVPGARQPV